MAAGQGSMDLDRSEIGLHNIVPGSSATFPGKSIGSRVSMRHKDLREAVEDVLGIKSADSTIESAIEDAVIAAGFGDVPDKDLAGGRRRRLKGGSRIGDEVKRIARAFVQRFNTAVSRTESDAIAAARGFEAAGSEIADSAARIGRFSTIGAVAGLAATVMIPGAAKYIPSPTWGQLGASVASFFKTVLVDVPVAVGSAAVQNPVIALALATALMKVRATRQGISVSQLMQNDAAAIAGAVQGHLAARYGPPATLREIAQRVQRPAGEGAAAMSAAATSSGAPAIGSTGVVPARRRSGSAAELLGRIPPQPAPASLQAFLDQERRRNAVITMTEDQQGGSTSGGRRRPLSLPTRRVRRSSFASKKRYTRRQRALRF